MRGTFFSIIRKSISRKKKFYEIFGISRKNFLYGILILRDLENFPYFFAYNSRFLRKNPDTKKKINRDVNV